MFRLYQASILILIAFCAMLHAETAEEIARELGARLRADPQLVKVMQRLETQLPAGIDRLHFSGPLVAQLFHDVYADRGTPGYGKEWNKKGDLSFVIRPQGTDEEACKQLSTLFPSLQRTNSLEFGSFSHAAPSPLLSIEVRKETDGRFSYHLSPGYVKVVKGEKITTADIRASEQAYIRHHPLASAHIPNHSLGSDYKGEMLADLFYLHSLGVPVGAPEKILNATTKANSAARDNTTKILVGNLRSAPHSEILKQQLLQNGLTAIASLHGSGTLPPEISKTPRLPSQMGDKGHLMPFDPNNADHQQLLSKDASASAPLVARIFGAPPEPKAGELVQKNLIPNPFLPYIGKTLGEIPRVVWARANIDPLTAYHRTNTSHAADAVASGSAFISTGKDSLLGGYASWGDGLYLSASPTLQRRYGYHIVGVKLDPGLVLGADIDIFVGAQDGTILVAKQGKGLTFDRKMDKAKFLQRAKMEEDVSDAIELLHQIPDLTKEEAQSARSMMGTHPLFEAYLEIRFDKKLSPTTERLLAQLRSRPEIARSEDLLAVYDLAKQYGGDKFLEIADLADFLVPISERRQLQLLQVVKIRSNKVFNRASRFAKLRDTNAPDVVRNGERKGFSEEVDRMVNELREGLAESTEGNTVRVRMDSLPALMAILQSHVEVSNKIGDIKSSARSEADSAAFKERIPTELLEYLEFINEGVHRLEGLKSGAGLDLLLDSGLSALRTRGVVANEDFDKLLSVLSGIPKLQKRVDKIGPLLTILRRLNDLRSGRYSSPIVHYDLEKKGDEAMVRIADGLNKVTELMSHLCKTDGCDPKKMPSAFQKLPDALRASAARAVSFAVVEQTPIAVRIKGADAMFDSIFGKEVDSKFRDSVVSELKVFHQGRYHHCGYEFL